MILMFLLGVMFYMCNKAIVVFDNLMLLNDSKLTVVA